MHVLSELQMEERERDRNHTKINDGRKLSISGEGNRNHIEKAQ
jgi:hypothetical protein